MVMLQLLCTHTELIYEAFPQERKYGIFFLNREQCICFKMFQTNLKITRSGVE